MKNSFEFVVFFVMEVCHCSNVFKNKKWVHAVVWKCGAGQRDTQTQTAVANIHFSSIPHAKCNN